MIRFLSEEVLSIRSDASKKDRTPPKCTKGQSCGMSCIPKGRACRKTPADISPKGKESLDKLTTISRGQPPATIKPIDIIKRGENYLGSALTDYEAISSRNPGKYNKKAEKAIAKAEMEIVQKLLPRPNQQHKDLADTVDVQSIGAYGSYYRNKMAEFFAITEGKGKPNKLVKTDDRAHASRAHRFINVGAGLNDAAFFHEMGHLVEFQNPYIEKIAREWVQQRASGPLEKLSNLTGDRYDEDEMAYPGKYISPYVGKHYPSGSTEVISMGIQHFADKDSMLELLKRDREHFLLIVGAIHG